MINQGLNVNKNFKEQVGKCMNTTIGEITQPFIKATFAKKNTSVLALIMFYETRGDNPKKYYLILYHKTLLMLTQLFYFFNNMALIKGRVIAPNVVFINISTCYLDNFFNIKIWINHISNFKLVNTLLCFIQNNETFIRMK